MVGIVVATSPRFGLHDVVVCSSYIEPSHQHPHLRLVNNALLHGGKGVETVGEILHRAIDPIQNIVVREIAILSVLILDLEVVETQRRRLSWMPSDSRSTPRRVPAVSLHPKIVVCRRTRNLLLLPHHPVLSLEKKEEEDPSDSPQRFYCTSPRSGRSLFKVGSQTLTSTKDFY